MTSPTVIIGASSATGSALARRLFQKGIPLFLTGRNTSVLHALASEVGARYREVDVLFEEQLAVAMGDASEGDGLSGLVYCPGSIVLSPISRVTPQQMAEAYALNAIGAAMAVKHAAAALKKASGSVVFFSTIAAGQGFPNHAIVASAKGAVEALTRSLAAELSPAVRVNCIAPSLTDTPLAKTLTANVAMADAIAKLHPIPRLGMPDDHAALADFLLSAEASWISGQILHVDGGRSTLRPRG